MADQIDREKVIYVDNVLSSLGYYRRQVIVAKRRIEKCEEELRKERETGGVHSPAIQSLDEAKYQKGTRIYQNKIEWLLGEKAMYEMQRDHFQKTIDQYHEFVGKLDPVEHDMIFMRYEKGESYDSIGLQLFMSRETVRRNFMRILMKW